MGHLASIAEELTGELACNANRNPSSNPNSNSSSIPSPNPNASLNSSRNANSTLGLLFFVRELTLILSEGGWRKLTLGLRVPTLDLLIFVS